MAFHGLQHLLPLDAVLCQDVCKLHERVDPLQADLLLVQCLAKGREHNAKPAVACATHIRRHGVEKTARVNV